VFPVRYELGFYIPKDGVLHSHRREQIQILQLTVDLHSVLEPVCTRLNFHKEGRI
jgi:hypothetical protein